MNKIKRAFSLIVRFGKKFFLANKEFKKLCHLCNRQNNLPAYKPVANKLLIVRLDEIGDYILWRNSLVLYKTSPKWKHCHTTLLGNKAWKSLFECMDNCAVDDVVWVDKNEYINNESYRFELWTQLRVAGFETVICPTKIRTPIFDDSCTLATGCSNIIATKCKASDNLNKHLYYNDKIYHEFFFNIDFLNWCCETNHHFKRPEIDVSLFQPICKNYILCYIGAAKKSRQLPVKTWVQVIKLLKQSYQKKIILAGGLAEREVSEQIELATQTDNITGTVSLAGMINYTAFADAVITGDTMEAHLAVSCKTPTVIFANGNTFARFSAYKEANIQGVETVYAKPFVKVWKKKNYKLFSNYTAVTSDITTITAEDILQALQKVNSGFIFEKITGH